MVKTSQLGTQNRKDMGLALFPLCILSLAVMFLPCFITMYLCCMTANTLVQLVPARCEVHLL